MIGGLYEHLWKPDGASEFVLVGIANDSASSDHNLMVYDIKTGIVTFFWERVDLEKFLADYRYHEKVAIEVDA